MTEVQSRKADHNIESVFLERWSPRAFAADEIPEAELFTLFEAARWAPSCYNSQPWRFLYARRGTPAFATFLGLLGEFNQIWAKNAAALVFVVSKKTFIPPGKDQPIESPNYSFDTGAAWGFLALQASKSGWATHGMAGFDRARAPAELHVPSGYHVEIAVAIGKLGEKASLPESLQAREAPSGRNAITQHIFEGGFPPGETL